MTGRLALLGASSALLLAVTAPAQATTRCRPLDMTIAVVTNHVSCSTGRSVANAYLNSTRTGLPKARVTIQGFRCVRHTVQAAAGWNATCTRGSSTIQIIPE